MIHITAGRYHRAPLNTDTKQQNAINAYISYPLALSAALSFSLSLLKREDGCTEWDVRDGETGERLAQRAFGVGGALVSGACFSYGLLMIGHEREGRRGIGIDVVVLLLLLLLLLLAQKRRRLVKKEKEYCRKGGTLGSTLADCWLTGSPAPDTAATSSGSPAAAAAGTPAHGLRAGGTDPRRRP